MLDVSSPKAGGKAELAKIGIHKSGEDGGGLLVDLDLVVKVRDEGEAEIIAATVPGAVDLYRRSRIAQDTARIETTLGGAAAGTASAPSAGTFGETRVRPPEAARVITLSSPDGGGELAKGDVEIVAAKIKATPKSCAYTLRIRIVGLDSGGIASLVEHLGASVDVEIETRQSALPFPSRRRVPGDLGEVVSGIHDGVEYAGVLRGKAQDEDAGEVFEVDDCGRQFIVPAVTVSGAIKAVAPEDSSIEVVVGAYTKAAKRAKVAPSWLHLVASLGETYLAAGASSADEWTVTPDVMSRALELAKGERAADAKAANA